MNPDPKRLFVIDGSKSVRRCPRCDGDRELETRGPSVLPREARISAGAGVVDGVEMNAVADEFRDGEGPSLQVLPETVREYYFRGYGLAARKN